MRRGLPMAPLKRFRIRHAAKPSSSMLYVSPCVFLPQGSSGVQDFLIKNGYMDFDQ
jgi:hypothetical protein